MMKHLLSSIPVLLALLTASGAAAQTVNTFSAGLDHLTRGELRKGGLSADEESPASLAAFILGRTRLNLDYARPTLSARLSVQHAGTWGSMDAGSVRVFEAWTQLRSEKGYFLKLGRQNLSYDDQRIFGNDDWAMTALSHDVIKAGYEGHGHKLHLILGFNQNPENMGGGSYFSGGLQPYKAMETVWYHWDVPRTPLGASLLFMNACMQGGTKGEDEANHQQQIFGTFLSFKPKGFSAEGALYWQRGEDEGGIPISAWMGSIKTVFTLGENGSSLYAGYDFMSGDENFATPSQGHIGLTRHEVIRGFNSLYGSHHKFFGAMDFFYVTTFVGGFTPGLQNLYAGGSWKPVKGLTFDASYHFLATAAKLRNADRPLGHEVEFSAGYSLARDIRLNAGYSFMYGTETMEVLKRSSENRRLHWGWIMLTVTPSIFSSKW